MGPECLVLLSGVQETIWSGTKAVRVSDSNLLFFFLGLGSAFLYQVAVVLISKYFKKRLALSTAISRAGMGLTFLLAPFTKFLIDQYDWTGESFCFYPINSARLHVCFSVFDEWKWRLLSQSRNEHNFLQKCAPLPGRVHGSRNLKLLAGSASHVSNSESDTPGETRTSLLSFHHRGTLLSNFPFKKKICIKKSLLHQTK